MHLLPDPPPCAREGCGKNAAAHLGFMLGHQYEEPETDRRQLERASGTPRTVDGPGCTPATLDGREAARRVLRASGALDDTTEVQPAPPAGATVAQWKCVECGWEEEERSLVCPNCATDGALARGD